MTIFLKYPVTVGERTCSELNFPNRPKVKHLLATDGKNLESVSADQALCAALTGEPELIIANIDAEDWAVVRVELAKVYGRFFGITEKDTDSEADEGNPTQAMD